MFSMIPVKASKDVGLWNWHHWQRTSCMSISRSVWACVTSCCACSKFSWAFCSPCILRLLSRSDSTTKSGPRLVPLLSHGLSLLHRRLLLLHLVFQDADACFGERRCFCLCQLLPGQCKSLGCTFRHVRRVSHIPGGSSTMLRPTHSLRPLVDVLVVFHVPLLATSTARVPAEKQPGLARCAVPDWSTQSRLSSPSLGLAADVTLHRAIPTSTRVKAISRKACNTASNAPQNLRLCRSLSPLSHLCSPSLFF